MSQFRRIICPPSHSEKKAFHKIFSCKLSCTWVMQIDVKKKLVSSYDQFVLFRCVHASLYEGLSVRPSVRNAFFSKHLKTPENSSEHLQTPPKPLILTILANCLLKYIEPNIACIVVPSGTYLLCGRHRAYMGHSWGQEVQKRLLAQEFWKKLFFQ